MTDKITKRTRTRSRKNASRFRRGDSKQFAHFISERQYRDASIYKGASDGPTLSGQTLKGYLFGERIGTGSFGAVYRAMQAAVGRAVAIKIILPIYANLPDFVRRFESEAQLIARLEHPHIVPLFDYWRDPDGAYLVMRILPSSLRMALTDGRMPVQEAVRLGDQMASALAFSTAGHRSPRHQADNILI
jgi:serine/threonine protein kinase